MKSLSFLTIFLSCTAVLHGDIIYTETFDIDGNSAAMGGSANGWDLTHARDDAVFGGKLYGGFTPPAGTTTQSVAYLTDAMSDDGSTGDAFNNIVLSDYDSLDFSFTYTNGKFGFTDVDAIRLAVEVDGTLYASTTTASPAASGADSTYSLSFDPTAANWLVVTPLAGEVTIGAAATSDLSGTITAVGIVQTNSGSAITDYDNFEIDAVRSTAAVPEPSVFAAFALLGPGIVVWRRRQRRITP
ncbi:MAG: PEP-CTERM sorting domain-containing protein [Planctomycetaceae bacterium]|nr:PEP-CTERM sorting domain-containing protein [Planctomycetaceae bacterium]